MTFRPDALEWPQRFARHHHRPPRVLHLGNVANYAYVNAKLMRRYGVEAEVIDADYYHIMASPEWYETEVIGDYGDEFFPDWTKVSLGEFSRPDWFIQGPRDLAFQYMALRATGELAASARVRSTIGRANTVRVSVENQAPVIRQVIFSDNRVFRLARSAAKSILYRVSPATRRRLAASSEPVVNDDPRRELVPVELVPLFDAATLLCGAMSHYDIIQGYTSCGMYPAAFGYKNFTAYELGTLRALPFEDSALGRVCAWTYREAPAVLVTNVDCLGAARRLGIEEHRIHPTLHAFDCDEAVAYREDGLSSLPISLDKPYFFAPARHHWHEGNESWLKGNDVAIHAAGSLKRAGYDFRIVFIEWGRELDLSKALIKHEDLCDRVVWLKPLSRPMVWKLYTHAVATIDQFRAAAFGGVALETMALGRRLITRFDEEAGAAFFRTPPPIFNCATAAEVYEAMRTILGDPHDVRAVGAAARDWMASEHSVERQLRTQFEIFSAMVGEPMLAKG